MVGIEVRHADRAHQALVAHFDHRLPGFDIEILARHRPVDQNQVEPVDADALQASLDRGPGLVAALVTVPDLGGDEDLVARHARTP
jgi:hypothetical protein